MYTYAYTQNIFLKYFSLVPQNAEVTCYNNQS